MCLTFKLLACNCCVCKSILCLDGPLMSLYTADMSITYVGPYLKIVEQPKKVAINVIACTNNSCINFAKSNKAKFCDECGTKIIESKLYKDEYKLTGNDIYRITHQRICVKVNNYNTLYAVPFNCGKDVPRNFYQVDTAINALNIADTDLTWFKDKYREELIVIDNFVGIGNTTICWGILRF